MGLFDKKKSVIQNSEPLYTSYLGQRSAVMFPTGLQDGAIIFEKPREGRELAGTL